MPIIDNQHQSKKVIPPTGVSAQTDDFIRSHLPPEDLWPEIDFGGYPPLAEYGAQINVAVEILDRKIADGMGDRPAFYYEDEVWSFSRLHQETNRIALWLVKDKALVPGNRVLIHSSNNPMMVACWFAVQKVGGICVTTMPMLRSGELAYIIERAKVTHALCFNGIRTELDLAAGQSPGLKHVHYFSATGKDPAEELSLELELAETSLEFAAVDTAADDISMIAFTSGTTGAPKGTVHFHRDVMAASDCSLNPVLGLGPDDVICGSPPIAFTLGVGFMMLAPMKLGAAVVLFDKPSPEKLLSVIERHQVTCMVTAPTMYRAMTPLVNPDQIASLKICVSGGENLSRSTFDGWHQATGYQLQNMVGSSELLFFFLADDPNDITPCSLGRPIPGYRAEVLDEDGQPAKVGDAGRLAIVGPTACKYFDDLENQKRYVEYGWNLTGDLFRRDEKGLFWYVARADDMIISSGYNISGPEVESALLSHAAVAECAVVGAPDPNRGSIVKAFVRLRNPEEAGDKLSDILQDHVKSMIAPYKYPRAIEFMAALPKTQSGKLQRKELRLRENAKITAAATSESVKELARELGADLVGIVGTDTLEAFPPDPRWPQTPGRISPHAKSVIVLAKRIPAGAFRVRLGAADRYLNNLVLRRIDRIAASLAMRLEEMGHPALATISNETDWSLKRGTYGYLSTRHLAVEAGLGTIGLNLNIVTPEYGSRVQLAAVLTELELTPDERLSEQVCIGEGCSRCLYACPPNAVGHFGLDKRDCSTCAQMFGYAQLTAHIANIMRNEEADPVEQVWTQQSLAYWLAMTRVAGCYGACMECLTICPVGVDYHAMLAPDLGEIEAKTDEKVAKGQSFKKARKDGEEVVGLNEWNVRWTGPEGYTGRAAKERRQDLERKKS